MSKPRLLEARAAEPDDNGGLLVYYTADAAELAKLQQTLDAGMLLPDTHPGAPVGWQVLRSVHGDVCWLARVAEDE